MTKNPIIIVTEDKWTISYISGHQISVMVDSCLHAATLEITDDGIDPEDETPPKGGMGLIKRIIGVILNKKPTGRVSLTLNRKKGTTSVPIDYYLTQTDWDTLVKSNFADPIRPEE